MIEEYAEKCYGCSLCAEICPNNAIKMKSNEEGFLYPKVDNDKCTKCGLCKKLCIADKERCKIKNVISSYALIHKSKEVLSKSTSGGAFTALSDYILDIGGIVYGAVFDWDFKVYHARAENKSTRDMMRGSKYVQSDLKDSYKQVKQDLLNGKTVLFSGTPCQIDGLKSYLKGICTDNLYLCDLICHGTPSPLIWREHVKLIEKKNKAKLKTYQFRPKKWGWHIHNECAVFENGKEYYSNAYSDLFKTIYYGRLAMRTSCHYCQYSNLNRASDITIGDCRHIENVYPDLDVYDGVSLVLVNTEKGRKILEGSSKDIELYPLNIEDVIQPPLQHPGGLAVGRKKFWDYYYQGGYKYAVKKYYGRLFTTKYRIKKILKKI